MMIENIIKKAVIGLMVSFSVPFLCPVLAETFCFEEAGQIYGINPSLLQSIARVESGLRTNAVKTNKNGSTDLGLMQINSAWVESLQLNRDKLLSDPCYNVMTGTKILKGCIDRWGYTWQAVGCYNAASESKRKGYSWKIYHELKKEGASKKTMLKTGDKPSKIDTSGQSLHFRIRSMEGQEIGGHP